MNAAKSSLLALIATFLFGQAPTPDPLVGSWFNQNLQTGRLTQVVVRRDDARTLVHAWGSCQPSDCDWGETAAAQWNGITVVNWDHGFATERTQLIPQPDGRLLVVTKAEYRDGSGREDRGSAEFFARETSKVEGPETAKARDLLRLVAETYRRLPPSRFESTETVIRSTGTSQIRSQVRSVVLASPPNKWRREFMRGGEQQIEIADGKTRWTVYPQSNEYDSVGQGSVAQPFNYDLVDSGRNSPEISRHERLGGVDCTVVRIDLGRGVTEDLWIEDATHLVRKDFETAPAITRELIFAALHVGEKFGPEAFTYVPEATHAVNRTQASRSAPDTMVGKPAPDITLRDLAGREVSLRDLRGKVVLLDFWGSWCGPCREALPMIELYHRGLRDKGLLVFGVDDEAAEIAREYLQKSGYTLPSLVDSKGEATRTFRVNAWPTTVLIDREGTVVFYESGAEPEKLRAAIRAAGAW